MIFRFILLTCFASFHFFSMGQDLNYREIFGEKYVEAELFIAQNKNVFKKYFPDSGEFQIAASIVFPEIIRFNELQNRIETEAIKTLYVQYGGQYANFSVGPFQMKPTFAEQLEKEYFLLNLKTNAGYTSFDTASTNGARIKRVERLSTLDGQLMYLSLFHEVSEERFHGLKFYTPVDRLRFLAAAYNSGFHNTVETIAKRAKERHFHTDLIFSTKSTKYCYSDISTHYFGELKIR
jgi:hypothetical protein